MAWIVHKIVSTGDACGSCVKCLLLLAAAPSAQNCLSCGFLAVVEFSFEQYLKQSGRLRMGCLVIISSGIDSIGVIYVMLAGPGANRSVGAAAGQSNRVKTFGVKPCHSDDAI